MVSAAALAAAVKLNLVAGHFVEVRELVGAEQRFFTAGNIFMTLFLLFYDFVVFNCFFY